MIPLSIPFAKRDWRSFLVFFGIAWGWGLVSLWANPDGGVQKFSETENLAVNTGGITQANDLAMFSGQIRLITSVRKASEQAISEKPEAMSPQNLAFEKDSNFEIYDNPTIVGNSQVHIYVDARRSRTKTMVARLDSRTLPPEALLTKATSN